MNAALFEFAPSNPKSAYEDRFYAHLSELASTEFAAPDSQAQGGKFLFSYSKYEGLGQAAFEDAERFEDTAPETIDFAEVERRVLHLQTSLTPPTDAKPADPRLIGFSLRMFEQWAAYEGMYPRTHRNPWRPAVGILECGRVFAVTDLDHGLRDLSQTLGTRALETGNHNVAIVTQASGSRISGFLIDDRFSLQAKVLAFLRSEAPGHQSPKPLSEIRNFLRDQNVAMTEDSIQIKITVPLKKSGVIGSTGKGHFFINSPEDLLAAYCFHMTKVRSSKRIMSRYQSRAAEFGDFDLKLACDGPALDKLV